MTRVIVVKRKKLLYILIAIIILIVIMLMIINRKPKELKTNSSSISIESKTKPESTSSFVAGVYSKPLTLGNYQRTLLLTVDNDQIKDLSITYSDSAVTTMFPLLSKEIDTINQELKTGTTLENIENSSSEYTKTLILQNLSSLVEQAKRQ